MKRRATRQLTRQLVESLGQKNISIEVKDHSNLSGAGKHNYIMTLDELLSITGTGGIVNNNLSAQGIDNTTISVMEYGTNVFTTASYTNFATKLPLPYTGKTVTIVNSTGFYMVVYPSTVGTTINGVDEFVVIPPDNKAYTFTCIANPLPGAWTWSPPAIGQYEFPEISVNHTTGTDTWLASIDGVNFETTYGGGAGNGIALLPNGTIWTTLPFQAMLTKIKVYTNILTSDAEAGFISVDRLSVFLDAPNSVAIQMPYMSEFTGSDPDWFSPPYSGFVTGATTLSNPPNVGDTGTLYRLDNQNLIIENNIGVGLFGNHFFGLGFNIKAGAPTKVYKFKVFFEYV